MSESQASTLKIAVEGCGHGTLHAIYASVEESCRVKGWEGVDLLIIGGDFQAVRNRHDLNVTSMPEKYRRMADFHEYYSGARTAPYLTIFIGGNHEASNHLFELYYGGWVAPNIYYLGAANVIRLGPLRIAGLSGIWKGYDYRKPHFERLPYSQDEMGSIYHVRELDVRKLLAVRTQVDIGLSHDWPQGVEWQGDYAWLFRTKDRFEKDAVDGKLGSVAARQCLERLRPPYWFSAHLHTKYVAVVEHGEYQGVEHGRQRMNGTSLPPNMGTHENRHVLPENPSNQMAKSPIVKEEDRKQVNAWKSFHEDARQADAEERDRMLAEQQSQKEEEERSGVRSRSKIVFKETFKKVTTDDSLGRAVTSVIRGETPMADSSGISNLDGCGLSRPVSLKRRREISNPDALDLSDEDNEQPAIPGPEIHSTPSNFDGTGASVVAVSNPTAKNPDAIDIDMSDEENEDRSDPLALLPQPPTMNENLPEQMRFIAVGNKQEVSDPSEDGGVTLNPATSSFKPMANIESVLEQPRGLQHSRGLSTESMEDLDLKKTPPSAFVQDTRQVQNEENRISDEMRAKLAALNPSFAPQPKIEVSPPLPLPETIFNKITEFLALGKCEPYQEFLQLLEIAAISKLPQTTTSQRPFKLEYDPEWLAILRTFASELSLGGSPEDSSARHRGDTYYQDRIVQEEQWIEDNVTKPKLLKVPENFTLTAPIYDPDLRVDSRDMPREVTNPQTSALCRLIGIENKFNISEEEREARIVKGPRANNLRDHGDKWGGRGGGRGRGGFNNRNGGGRGGGRGGRGGGRRGY